MHNIMNYTITQKYHYTTGIQWKQWKSNGVYFYKIRSQ